MLKVVDIYCGAGGLSEGFSQAKLIGNTRTIKGFKVVYGIDKDKDSIETFRKNHFPDVGIEKSRIIAECRTIIGLEGNNILNATDLDSIDVIVGGPNCQGVSAAGLRNRKDPRNQMFVEFFRLVEELQPKWFVMENVPGLTHANNRPLLAEIMRQFSSIPGYRVAADVLLAADFGCPQFRYRLFVIGTKTDAPIRFPRPTYGPKQSIDGISKQTFLPFYPSYRTVGDTLRDLESISPTISSDGSVQEVQISTSIYNHAVFALSHENKERIKTIHQGGDWRLIPVSLLPARNFSTRASDQKGAYGRLNWDEPAYTITASAGNISAGPFTHPSIDRPLSAREVARLQGFSDEYIFEGDLNSVYHQIGNAVPPPLAKAVAETILTCHYAPELANVRGVEGRITLELLESGNSSKFPVLTPRLSTSKRSTIPGLRTEDANLQNKELPLFAKELPLFAEEPNERIMVSDEQLKRVHREAALPGNVRAGKRARTILGYFEGKSLKQLLDEAKVSEVSVKKWVNGFYKGGSEGWRAYHTPLRKIAGGDSALTQRLEEAVLKVRTFEEIHPVSSQDSTKIERLTHTNKDRTQEVSKRPHMNSYLRFLIKRYQSYSVEKLISLVEKKLGREIGTVYVADLLAICDIVIGSQLGFDEREEKLSQHPLLASYFE